MRRKKIKLTTFAWYMVLLTGIFQILTFILDQAVIQKQEETRMAYFERSNNMEKRSTLLEQSRRLNKSLRSTDDLIFIITSSKLSENRKQFLYFSALFDQTRLMEDIFRDDLIEKQFSKKTIKAADNQDENKVKDLNYVEYFKTLVEDNHKLSENIEYTISINSEYYHRNGEIFLVNGKKFTLVEVIQPFVEHNFYYLGMFLTDINNLLIDVNSQLLEDNKKIFKINEIKQLYLLLGVIAQLLSLFFLALLFRHLLIKY
tara:strand:- start:96 stop:872 length:777 start_codon:yes stop_codon:yes gene_type:complete